jgi:hypothetical protein
MVVDAVKIVGVYTPEEGKVDHFQVAYIGDEPRKEHLKKCTRGIYQQVISRKMTRMARHKFKVYIDEKTKTVEQIDANENTEFYGFEAKNPDGTTKNPEDSIGVILFARYPDGTVDIKARPQNLDNVILDEIRSAIKASDDIKALDLLDEKYLVTDVRNNIIHVDPTVR